MTSVERAHEIRRRIERVDDRYQDQRGLVVRRGSVHHTAVTLQDSVVLIGSVILVRSAMWGLPVVGGKGFAGIDRIPRALVVTVRVAAREPAFHLARGRSVARLIAGIACHRARAAHTRRTRDASRHTIVAALATVACVVSCVDTAHWRA